MSYFSRITLKEHPRADRLAAYAGARGYREHQMLWGLFEQDPEAERDFLYRRVSWRGRPRYFLLSGRPPVNDLDLWHIDPPKPYRPQLAKGQKLRFMLRANPVVTRKDAAGKSHRHDVVMDRKQSMDFRKTAPDRRPLLADIVRDAGLDWLSGRSERCGFRIEPGHVRVDAYQQHRLQKNRGGTQIRFSTLDFEGLLTVVDPTAFEQALRQGVGPAKSFGCGLMLVKPYRVA